MELNSWENDDSTGKESTVFPTTQEAFPDVATSTSLPVPANYSLVLRGPAICNRLKFPPWGKCFHSPLHLHVLESLLGKSFVLLSIKLMSHNSLIQFLKIASSFKNSPNPSYNEIYWYKIMFLKCCMRYNSGWYPKYSFLY